MKLKWQDYDAAPFFHTKHVRLLLCRKWWLGYQSYGDYCGNWVLDLCVVPGLMLQITWKVI